MTSMLTGRDLPSLELRPNYEIRRRVDAFVAMTEAKAGGRHVCCA